MSCCTLRLPLSILDLNYYDHNLGNTRCWEGDKYTGLSNLTSPAYSTSAGFSASILSPLHLEPALDPAYTTRVFQNQKMCCTSPWKSTTPILLLVFGKQEYRENRCQIQSQAPGKVQQSSKRIHFLFTFRYFLEVGLICAQYDSKGEDGCDEQP